ncbi:MAG: nodulation protein NfeD [Paludibacter sp.]|nr:nodulation protein NfeD [Paludibacter sp.]
MSNPTQHQNENIKKEINSTTWLYVQRGIAEAQKESADIIILHINTYGGEVLYADSIRTRILNCEIPIYAFIDNNAASAGALISIACDKIFMRSGGNIGAATVVNETGAAMPDKYQSYMRATMRSTAEAHGQDTVVNGRDTTYRWHRDPQIAEAMVDDRVYIAGVIDSGKTLTFTAQEAINYRYCEGLAENVEDIIENQLHIDNYTISVYKPTALVEIKGFLSSTIIQGLLIMLIIGGIYFELQTPGVGFPLAAAVTAAVLYFAPLYIDGLAANWEIIIFVVGLILVGLEIFVIPGFGVAGIAGIACIFGGLILSLLGNVNFDFQPVSSESVGRAFLTVTGGVILGFLLIWYLSSKIGKKGLFRNVALVKTLDNQSGYIGVPVETAETVGKEGNAYTVLRLSGKVQIDNEIYDAISEDGFIEKGTRVKVIKYETGQVYVVKV